MTAHRTTALVPVAAGGSVDAALEGNEELISTIVRPDATQVLIMLRRHEGKPYVLFRRLPDGRSFSFRVTELGTVLAALNKVLSRLRSDNQ